MKLLKGKKDLIPQKSKLNLTAHRSPIKRSMLCCLHHTGGAKGRAMERSRRRLQEEKQKSKIEREWVGRKDKEPGV